MPPEEGLQFSTATGAGGDQLLGGDAVDVEVVDERDVAADRCRTSSFVRRPGRTGPCTTRASRGSAPA